MKTFETYIDEYGMYSEKFSNEWSSGDSMQRVGFKFLANYFKHKIFGTEESFLELKKAIVVFYKQLDQIRVSKGIYCRHPRKSKWTSDYKETSRDQHISLIVALGFLQDKKELWSFTWRHILRLGVFNNIIEQGDDQFQKPWYKRKVKLPDITSPAHWGMLIRAWRAWPLYPVLLLGDLFNLIGTFITIYNCKVDPSTYDDISGMCLMFQEKYILPTPIGWLNRKIYFKYRPAYMMAKSEKPDTIIYTRTKEISGAKYSLYRYFKWDWQPPFDVLYDDIIDKILGS